MNTVENRNKYITTRIDLISKQGAILHKTGKGSLILNYVIPSCFNPLNAELNPICYLLALLNHHFLHVSRISVKSLTLRLLMSCIYGAHILDVSRSNTTKHHSR